MISISNAFSLVAREINALPRNTVSIKLSDALGSTLSEPIHSPIDQPPFHQSSMDGYALGSLGEKSYSVIGESPAGSIFPSTVKKGESVRIFTGSAIPDGCVAVVMQERVNRQGNTIVVEGEVDKGANIRPAGEQLAKGQLALPEGTVLTPSSIGFLSGLGLTEAKVYSSPKVSILITGDELARPGEELKPGQVYESNAIMLEQACLEVLGYKPQTVFVADRYEDTVEQIARLLESQDIVLCSGGISVGDYDYVGKAMKALGVQEVFYKVAQKPGKPLFFGKKGKTLLFGLPGNPASSLTAFYVYVKPSIKSMLSGKEFSIPWISCHLQGGVESAGRGLFLKAKVEGGKVVPLGKQQSSMLHSFALANAIAYIPANKVLEAGDKVEALLI